MDIATLDYLQSLAQIASRLDNMRSDLEQFTLELRKSFVFDNVAVYLLEDAHKSLEVKYARAIGRAKTAEADAAWGETFASQVVRKGKLLVQDPSPEAKPDDRLQQAYLLGLPLLMDQQIHGALVFVRFGGPPYEVPARAHDRPAAGVALTRSPQGGGSSPGGEPVRGPPARSRIRPAHDTGDETDGRHR